jgi:hypothetical protein
MGNDPAQGENGETNPICDGMSLRKEDAQEHMVSGSLL